MVCDVTQVRPIDVVVLLLLDRRPLHIKGFVCAETIDMNNIDPNKRNLMLYKDF